MQCIILNRLDQAYGVQNVFFYFQEELKAKRLGGAGSLVQMRERFVQLVLACLPIF